MLSTRHSLLTRRSSLAKTYELPKTLCLVQDIEMAIDQAVLDTLWDFSDPVASEQRFRTAGDDPELQTQVARALGLQGRFGEAEALLDSIEDVAPATRTRILLERGRLVNSSGDPGAAVPLFAEAAALGEPAGLEFLAIDAIHMLAIADGIRASDHTARGLDLVARSRDPRTKRWAVSLHNNLGWRYFNDGDAASALREFEAAYEASVAFGTDDQRFSSRWAIARACRELGRTAEARDLQDALLAERPDDRDVLGELRLLRGR
jgi:tetratricopeptide (TPR) repeat protein